MPEPGKSKNVNITGSGLIGLKYAVSLAKQAQ
jgi:hypothetical protein